MFLIAPLFTQIPDNFSFDADLVVVNDVYDPVRGAYEGGVYTQADYLYEAIGTKEGVVNIQNRLNLRTLDNEPIASIEHVYGIDRTTGKHALSAGDKNRDGFLFAPRHVGKEDVFTYWHVTYDAPAVMTFAGEEDVHGVRAFRFETHYEGTRIDVAEEIQTPSSADMTLGVAVEPYLQIWVEPLTGRLIKYRDDAVSYYYDKQTGAYRAPARYTVQVIQEHSVESNAQIARSERTKTQLVDWYIPALCAIAGIVLLVQAVGGIRYIRVHVGMDRVFNGSAILVLLISLTTFGAWFNNAFATLFIARGLVVSPLTAVCFAVFCSALLMRKKPQASAICGAIVVFFAGVQVLASLKLLPLGLDAILFGDLIQTYGRFAHMTFYAALSFTCVGLVPVVASRPRLRNFHFAEVLSVVVIIFSFVMLLPVLFDAVEGLVLPVFSGASMLTIGMFLLLGVLTYTQYREHDEYATGLSGVFSVSGILLAAIVTVMLFAGMLDTLGKREANARFTDEVNRVVRTVEDRVRTYVSMLEGAQGFFSASTDVTRDTWRLYIGSLELQKNYPGVQGVGYSLLVSPEERDAHIESVRAEGYPDYTIRPEGVRDVYSSVIYLEPFDERNQRALGFDMYHEPTRRAAMSQARDFAQPEMSGTVTLVQETGDDVQPGFLIYVPVYANGMPHDTVDERRANIVGYAYSPFRARNFIEGILGKYALKDIGLRITNGVSSGPQHVLYDNTKQELSSDEVPRFTEARTVFVAGRSWTLTFISSHDFGASLFTQLLVPAVIFAGILVSGLLAFMFYTLTFSRQRALEYADKVTEDLRVTKKEIEERLQNTERLNRVMVDRELKMREMKEELRALKGKV